MLYVKFMKIILINNRVFCALTRQFAANARVNTRVEANIQYF